MSGPLRLGTRGSALALAQARLVAGALPGEVELVEVVTSGDRQSAAGPQERRIATLSGPRPGGDKERWVRELDAALLDGSVDLAVHSAKDVPADLAQGVALVAAPPRADPRDALCGAGSLDALGPGARVGTSSLRRAAQLRALREDLEIVELRGNVDTRLAKLRDGGYDAIVLALAGLERLGRGEEAEGVLDELVPAAGQGTLALCARADDGPAREAAAAVADEGAMTCLLAERALVRSLDADCHTPVGAHATPEPSGSLRLRAFVGATDGSAWLRDELTADDPEALGTTVAQRLLAAGAAEVLGR